MDPGSKSLFGIAAEQVTSTTRATWSQQDINTFHTFAKDVWQSGITGSFADLPSHLELIDLVQDLGLLEFWNMRNTNGDRLGPILKKKMVRKLEKVWNHDLPALLLVSDAVRVSPGRARLQQQPSACSLEEPDELQQPVTSEDMALRKFCRITASGSIKKPHATTFTIRAPGLRLATMLQPAAGGHEKSSGGLVLRSLGASESVSVRHTALSRLQHAIRRRIESVPMIQAPPTPGDLARKRGRTIVRTRAGATSTSNNEEKKREEEDEEDNDEYDVLAKMKVDLDRRWNKYVE